MSSITPIKGRELNFLMPLKNYNFWTPAGTPTGFGLLSVLSLVIKGDTSAASGFLTRYIIHLESIQ